MAALQKIRSYGKVVIIVVGLALFAFIAEEFVRALSYTQTESRQRIGKIYGEKINYQDFNAMVDEYSDVIKFSNGLSSLTDDQIAMIRDQVWQTLVNSKIIEHECSKLGISVTDAELQDIINNGRSPMLAQTPFRTQQGGFDANALKQFLSQYDEIMNSTEMGNDVKDQYMQMYNYWKFVEKNVRQQTLAQKYQTLLNGAVISNPIAAKAHYDGRINENEIVMAVLPYNTASDITVSDSELKAKYNEMKEQFNAQQETRDIQYIDVEVQASEADKQAIFEEMEGYARSLEEGAEPAKVVREATSLVPYSALPIRCAALPTDIDKEVDAMEVGQQKGPYLNEKDNTLNIIRIIDKVMLPDSIELRQLGVPGADMASVEKTADSILTALSAGESFDTIAKKYDQSALRTWITSAQYERQTVDENNRRFIEAISNAPVNAYQKIVLDGQGIVIAQVTDRRNIIPKYHVAVIKRTQDFSKETYNKAFNNFSSFLAGNATAEDINANAAAAGYTVQSRQSMGNTEHTVANVRGTRDALRWIFNGDTKIGDVSPLYECGDNNHLLVVILNGIHKKGYQPLTDPDVKDEVNAEALKDKQAAALLEKLQGVKSMADMLKMADVQTDTIKHVTFTNNAFVSKVGSSEPALSGAVSKAAKGDFVCGVKGNAGIYAFQVLGENKLAGDFDQKKEEEQASMSAHRAVSNFTSELYEKAKVVDNRYVFY
ncbi:MAG: SurA N-terminal domain-containing protein [Bacteroidaceae bacterium]|nr:SurA N-terminal domain-containing protein [Bacteroidaceae bacterium]